MNNIDNVRFSHRVVESCRSGTGQKITSDRLIISSFIYYVIFNFQHSILRNEKQRATLTASRNLTYHHVHKNRNYIDPGFPMLLRTVHLQPLHPPILCHEPFYI